MAESIDRLKLAPDDETVERDPDPSDSDAGIQQPEHADELAAAEGDDDAAEDAVRGEDDPRELRFQLRRAKRKLKEADLQTARLKKMAAQEAIERTRVALAHNEASERVDRIERVLRELEREHKDVTRDLERWREAAQQGKVQVEALRDRRRKEREEAQQFGLGTVIQEMLPVFDHLELAITHASSDPGQILAGVQMVMDQLDRTLERLMVERVQADPGQPFLPECHEAVVHVDDSPHPHGSIVALLRPGYMLNGRLLRAARVSVASRPEETAQPTEEAAQPAAEPVELEVENVADDATRFVQPIPLPLEPPSLEPPSLEEGGEVVFDPVPEPGEKDPEG